MEDSTQLRNLRKRVSTEQDWSFFSARGAAHTPSHDSAAAGSGAAQIGGGGGGWQLNPHQSKNELNSKPDTARSESPPPVIVSPWDLSNANRPPSPPLSPTHRKPTDDASPRLHSPQRRLDSPDRD